MWIRIALSRLHGGYCLVQAKEEVMYARDLAYWLQGYFELNECEDQPGAAFNMAHIGVLSNHIKLVKKYDWDKPDSRAHHFVTFLEGTLESFPWATEKPTDHMTKKIKARLADCFQHEIDPKIEPDSKKREELQDTHDGKPKKPKKPKGRGRALEVRPSHHPGGHHSGGGTRFMC